MSNTKEVKRANPEQEMAIKHSGGVILQAGAGSGKTFVLIEHLIYKFENFINKNLSTNEKEFSLALDDFLSKLVVITFTNKAAGELSLRLRERIELLSEIESDSKWNIIGKSIDKINLGTIHSFCMTLLKSGLFKEVDELGLYSDQRLELLIRKIFEDFVLTKMKDYPRLLMETLILSKESIISSLIYQFQDSGIRDYWGEKNLDDRISEKNFFKALIELSPFKDVFLCEFEVDVDKAKQKNQWYQYFKNLKDLTRKNSLSSYKDYLEYSKFFQGIKRLPSAPKESNQELRDFFKHAKDFRDFIKKNHESISLAFSDDKETFNLWSKLTQELHQYVDIKLKKKNGLTFSDLEYYLYEGMKENSNSLKSLSARYNYFVIDEFQDTSFLQFDIIAKLASYDWNKCFFVGDIKQAIYGFRGGELHVFKDCLQKFPKALELKTNYRSNQQIVNFNNKFFDFIFSTGENFEGVNPNPIPSYHQVPGTFSDSEGEVRQLQVVLNEEISLDSLRKFDSSEIDQIEAVSIYNDILSRQSSYKNFAVLYRKLAPSRHLVKLFESVRDTYTVHYQVKVKIEQEPIWGIFSSLIELLLSSNSNDQQFVFNIKSYLQLLELHEDVDMNDLGQNVFIAFEYFGLFDCFCYLLQKLGISTSYYSLSLSVISDVIKSCHENLEDIWRFYKDSGDKKVSLDIQQGHGPKHVYLMTVHASKGLEFDHVYLAGVHTNGRSSSDRSFLGKNPGSFRWKRSEKLSETYKSPENILEGINNKLRELSEDKRLLYVACTRAKQSLSWVNLDFPKDVYGIGKNHWINAFTKYLTRPNNIQIISMLFGENDLRAISSLESNNTPLFHQHSMGISAKEKILNITNETSVFLPELSVTNLSELIDCPRKFYLSQIGKLDDDSVKVLSDIHQERSFIENSDVGISSSDRGDEIHNILHKITLKKTYLHKQTDDALEFACIELRKYHESHTFFPEYPLKFDLFSQVLSGRVDLYLSPKNKGNHTIVDYKTGLKDESLSQKYFFQLKCYAYALYKKNAIPKDCSVELILLYLDMKDQVKLIIDYQTLKYEIYQDFKYINQPNIVNTKSCSFCLFGKLCRGEGVDIATNHEHDRII